MPQWSYLWLISAYFAYYLFVYSQDSNIIVLISQKIYMSNVGYGKTVMNGEQVRIRKKTVIAYLKAQTPQSTGGTDEKHEKPHSDF
jgi:hypothetical protein